MKKLLSVLFIPFSILILIQSCKKNDPDSYNVTYRINPVYDCITKITYTGSSGSPVVITDYTKFVDGKMVIPVSIKPFDAKIVVETNNQTATTLYFDILIKSGDKEVWDTVMSSVASAMSISVNQAEYIIPTD
jgi:hypothetical protein